MALGPTDGRIPGSSQQGRIQRPQAPRTAPTRQPDAPERQPEPSVQKTPGRRLRAAVTDAEIDAQIKRLMTLIANDKIDPNAPPGSYINILL